MNTSPTKRRVLGALDPNACSPKPKARHDGKLLSTHSPVKYTKPVAPRQTSPSRVSSSRTPERDAESKKRRSPSLALASAASRVDETDEIGRGEPAAKRLCLDDDMSSGAQHPRGETRGEESPPSSSSTTRTTTTRHRSASPDTPSVFDISAADNSQVTILTEPDAAAPAPAPAPAPVIAAPLPPPRPRMTREQARAKAEILRLRLGLASYKVRTGQTDVPLDRLEAQLASASASRPQRHADIRPQPSSNQHSVWALSASTAAAASASFPPPTNNNPNTSTSRGPRRPLPAAAPTRRASSFSTSSHNYTHTQPPPQPQFPHPQNHQHHRRRQSDLPSSSRHYQSTAAPDTIYVPPRPRTATGGIAPAYGFAPRRGSVAVLDEEGEEEDRGGAASGLLSLARS
ncbi:hypothetical protein C8A05DRAFT_39286 [Staphylotrichum tortipilum]|uniref:Cyclin-dependent kinase n=1 Tax=Staphylotrichum tortipilum TaxID=2831512 RepID=A0AAN6MAH0_9PEZI|nr:hypothetical protein C8A05DRAFT_39286 [Staphylotrichum longicolle]